MANVYVKAVCLGIIAGMRSMSAPALVSNKMAREQSPLIVNSPFKLLAAPKAANALKMLAAGEMIADKTSVIPNRISPFPLVARALSGAVCGASLCASEGTRADLGGVVGGLTAIASTYGFYHLRRRLGEDAGLPDTLLGLAEDAIVVAGGISTLRSGESA